MCYGSLSVAYCLVGRETSSKSEGGWLLKSASDIDFIVCLRQASKSSGKNTLANGKVERLHCKSKRYGGCSAGCSPCCHSMRAWQSKASYVHRVDAVRSSSGMPSSSGLRGKARVNVVLPLENHGPFMHVHDCLGTMILGLVRGQRGVKYSSRLVWLPKHS